MTDIKEQLIDAAQTFIQTRGYNGFSYRDIAAEVGIRSASIHYHFPSKADLGAAVAARYTDRFLERLEDASNQTTGMTELLSVFASLFKETLSQDRRMCLCGMLGAEVAALPTSVADEAKRFFEATLAWLSGVLSRRREGPDDRATDNPKTEAAVFLATFEGAMILARGIQDPRVFDDIAEAAIRRHR